MVPTTNTFLDGPASNMMRNTADLIAELEQETASGRFAMIALVVVFDDKQQLILGNHGTNQQRLALLNDFVDEGGQPLGFVSVKIDGKFADIASRPLGEYEGDGDALEVLKDIATHAGNLYIQRWKLENGT